MCLEQDIQIILQFSEKLRRFGSNSSANKYAWLCKLKNWAVNGSSVLCVARLENFGDLGSLSLLGV